MKQFLKDLVYSPIELYKAFKECLKHLGIKELETFLFLFFPTIILSEFLVIVWGVVVAYFFTFTNFVPSTPLYLFCSLLFTIVPGVVMVNLLFNKLNKIQNSK